MAAAYELRKYPEYKDVIVRMCEQSETVGPAGKMLKDEMLMTAGFLKGK